jgi:festuclavine dehydrogenase
MVILLTGGIGKTSLRLTSLLRESSIPFLLTSRKGQAAAPSGMQAARFDWLDSTTFSNPFNILSQKITAIYLIAPETADPVTPMNAFIDYAINEHGVKRFVLLGGSTLEKGESMYTGRVWSHLEECRVEFCVLRATWFMGMPLPPIWPYSELMNL